MRPLLVAAAAAVLAAAGLVALGRGLGLGPLAPGAPPSWVYVAIARGGDGQAQEVEVIDVASGERQLVYVGRPIGALALSRDRRSLYVGIDRGTIFEFDAVRGTYLGEIRLSSSGDVERLLALPDGRLLAITTVALDANAYLVDAARRRELAHLDIERRLVGKLALSTGDRALLSAADRGGRDLLLEIGLDPFRLERETIVFTGPPPSSLQTAPPVFARRSDGTLAYVSAYVTRVAVLPGGDAERRQEIELGRFARPTGFRADAELSPDGSALFVCMGGNVLGERYRVDLVDLRTSRAGNECGELARGADSTVYLGVRGKPELRILDPQTGATQRILPLAGIAVRVTG